MVDSSCEKALNLEEIRLSAEQCVIDRLGVLGKDRYI